MKNDRYKNFSEVQFALENIVGFIDQSLNQGPAKDAIIHSIEVVNGSIETLVEDLTRNVNETMLGPHSVLPPKD